MKRQDKPIQNKTSQDKTNIRQRLDNTNQDMTTQYDNMRHHTTI